MPRNTLPGTSCCRERGFQRWAEHCDGAGTLVNPGIIPQHVVGYAARNLFLSLVDPMRDNHGVCR